MVGGELTLEMLDLKFNPIAKFHEAPIQLKANGGVLLVDDFGRQRIRPQRPAQSLDRAAREPRRLPDAAHRQEIPDAVRRADRLRHQPRSRRRWPTKRSCAASRTRFGSSDPTLEQFTQDLRAELPQRNLQVSPGDGRVPAAPPLRPVEPSDARVPSTRSARPGDGDVPLSGREPGITRAAARCGL